MRERSAYWIGGTLTALIGVALVRLLSPELAGAGGSVAAAAGYALVVVGITIIARATGGKRSDDFIAAEKDSKG